jgi:RimJ/RimL family protein N-acetyltransferase
MNISIRRATADDAARLSEFASAAFIDWYLPDNRAEDVQTHVRNTFAPDLQRNEIKEPGQYVLLAESAGDVAGYGMLRLNRPCAGLSQIGLAEIRRFYVGRAWHGTGLATTLMQAVTAHGASLGASGFWLTCWERNPRALAFYAKCGFRDIGTTTFTVGHDVQTDRLLYRPALI